MPRKAKVAPAPDALPGETLTVEYWPIARPQPYPRNARRLTDRAVDTLAASIKNFGFRQPIVVDAFDVIVVGHTRLLAAQKLGLEVVPVHVAAGLTPAQCRAYRLMDNRTADETSWDLDLLEAEMRELQALDMAELAGFEDAQITEMLKPPPATDADAVPDAPAVPVSRAGDLWLLGSHRVLCGDATDADAVARLMDGAKAGLMATDPPYGVGLRLEDNHDASNAAKGTNKKYRHFETIMGDDVDGPKLQGFLESVFLLAITALNENAAWYLWHAQLTQGFFAAAAAAAAQLLVHRQIIWVKPHFVFGHGDYHWQHELCFYGWRKTKRPPFYGPRNQSTTWMLDEGGGSIRKEQFHPTQKPVELFVRAINNHLKPGEICYEPFGGSGSQIIAAEKTATRCFALELAPAYVDVIVARWQAFTGLKATLADDGRTFEETGATRLHETEKEPAKEAPAETAPAKGRAKAKARGKQKARVPQGVSRHRVAH